MKFALSTNWRGRAAEPGEAIADKALELGFDALELGFSTTPEQAEGFRRRLDEIPAGSVHAFCPVPVSAPCGSPELYALATTDENERAVALFHVKKNIEFAASMGAGAVVLHAGRAGFGSFLAPSACTRTLRAVLDACGGDVSAKRYAKALAKARKTRSARAAAVMESFLPALDSLVPVLEKNGVVLALENLPYLEGFPDEEETKALLARFEGAPVKAWFDTGHNRVRKMHGWIASEEPFAPASCFAGMHVNDVKDLDDDHFAPGGGNVDFAALKDFASALPRVVLEPKSHVAEEALAAGLAALRAAWN